MLDVGCGAGTDLARFAQGRRDRHRRRSFLVGDRAGEAEFRAAGAARRICARPTASTCRSPTTAFDFVFAHGVVQYTARDQALVDECRRVLKPGGDGDVPGLQPHLVAERAVEGDESAARARGRAGARSATAPASSAALLTGFRDVRIVEERFPVKSRLHGGWKGHAVQHLLRRHLQRPAARAGCGASAGTCWPSAANDGTRRQSARVTGTTSCWSRGVASDATRRHADRRVAGASVMRSSPRHRRRRADRASTDDRAARAMQLLNADGSYSEVSGNGVRAWPRGWRGARGCGRAVASSIDTDAGVEDARVARRSTDAGCTLSRRDGPTRERRSAGRSTSTACRSTRSPFASAILSASSSARSPRRGCIRSRRSWRCTRSFPQVRTSSSRDVEAPDRVRILIWERGVGPTEASGTGACASAVAAISLRRRGARRAGRLAGRRPARRVDGGRPVPDRMGRARLRGDDALAKRRI